MIEEALYTILSTNAGVSAIVSTRIYSVIFPQDVETDSIAITKVSSTGRELHHSGTTKTCESLFQISCLCKDPKSAKILAEAVRAALHGYAGTVGGLLIFRTQIMNEIDLYDDDLEDFISVIDVLIMHRENN